MDSETEFIVGHVYKIDNNRVFILKKYKDDDIKSRQHKRSYFLCYNIDKKTLVTYDAKAVKKAESLGYLHSVVESVNQFEFDIHDTLKRYRI